MTPLPDPRAFYRGVDFPAIACFIRDNLSEDFAVSAVSTMGNTSAHEALWAHHFEPSRFTLVEKMFAQSTMAMVAIKYVHDMEWTDWPLWSGEKRLEAAESTLDAVARLYLHMHIRRYYGDKVADVLGHKIEETRFCRPRQ